MAINIEKFIWVARTVEGRKNPQRQKKYLHTCNKCTAERGYFVKTWDTTRSNDLCISCTKLLLGPTVNKNLCYVCNERQAITNKRCGNCDSRQYRRDNSVKIKEKAKFDQQARMRNDLNFKLTRRLRSRLYCALDGRIKTGSAVSDLGCTIEELRKHLESDFYPNSTTGEVMSWGNWSKSGWHIDHVKPLASFDLANPDEFKKACHYTNLQPLWAHENLSKGDKIAS